MFKIVGTEKRTNVIGPQEKRVIAFHECGHALTGWLLKYTDALMKVFLFCFHSFNLFLELLNTSYMY